MTGFFHTRPRKVFRQTERRRTNVYGGLQRRTSALAPAPTLMMIVHTRAMLAAPLLAIAVVVSSASAALLRPPFPPRGSGLLVRQDGEVKIPQECDPQCVPAINTVNVSTHPSHRSRSCCHTLNRHDLDS